MTPGGFKAALKECGVKKIHTEGTGPPKSVVSDRVTQKHLAEFVACIRQGGFDVKAGRASGEGPLFYANGVDINTTQFRKVEGKCRNAFVEALRKLGSNG
jgi:hypothetical protein